MKTTVEHQTRPTRAELLDRAKALQPLLRKHAVTGDNNRRTCDEVIAALTENGFFRLRTPVRFGGYGADARLSLIHI